MSKVYRFTAEQFIPASIATVWEFMSSPQNLKHITPASMNFEILENSADGPMYPGMVIMYKVSPLPLTRVRWVTEITHVEELKYFVDEQRFGPYSFWHHKHFLEEVEGGVMMRDIVDYKIPFGWLGDLANAILVSKKLKQIFAFRKQALEKFFPA
ncbi:MAG: SRPBCC family protein [Bacteroidia bacterium]|nr:SRPBCC family protein [Bacteroidia bacterium]